MTEILPTKKRRATRELVKDPVFFFTTSWKDLQSKLQKSPICEIACLGEGEGTKHNFKAYVGVPDVSMETVSIRMKSLILVLKTMEFPQFQPPPYLLTPSSFYI